MREILISESAWEEMTCLFAPSLEVAREIACRLRDIGWPPERIQEVTGLSGEELKKLFPDEQ
ncbi:hypothetical protein CF636_002355 [Escherichia coli]|nr:hypothetical protein [Escherichia coli]